MPSRIEAFKSGLAAIRRRRAMVPYRATQQWADELRDLLRLLEPDAVEPRTGVKLMVSFYRSDAKIFNLCDDSSGHIGDIFREDAAELFVRFAADVADRKWLVTTLHNLVAVDDYGIRSAVLERADRFLPEQSLRELANRFWQTADNLEPAPRDRGHSDHEFRHALYLVEKIARQLNDPVLLERVRRRLDPGLGTASCVSIARAWLAAGQAATALDWLQRLPPNEAFMAHERDTLLLKIHSALGDIDSLEQLAWRVFLTSPHSATLDNLLDIVGGDQREPAIDRVLEGAAAQPGFDMAVAHFIADVERHQAVADYIISRHGDINGRDWYNLTGLIKLLGDSAHPLALTALYRPLLESILARAETSAYGHGARYLRCLDRLSEVIVDWQTLPTHQSYFASVEVRHRLKRTFWARYRPNEGN